jgi:hypothetical protein
VGDFIGTNPGGDGAVGNGGNGIEVRSGTGNTIGSSISSSLPNIISGNSKDGILLDSGANDTTIWRSYLGINIHATALGNGTNGVEVKSNNNTIGGNPSIDFAYRNYISGNDNDGLLFGSGTSGNLVQGAFIGLDTSGTIGVGNTTNGIEIAGNSNTIGGTTNGVENVISGNGSDGVLIDSGTTGNLVEGDNAGTNYNASGTLPNSGNGLEIAGDNNTVGGSVSGAGNVIADNSKNGVLIDSTGSGDTVSQNSIYANTGLGISLASGANNNIVAPTISTATLSSGTLTVTGTFTATTTNPYVLEFFANSSGDAEGRIYLGSKTVTPSSTGTVNFTFTTTNTSQLGTYPLITATLTDATGDTSEFSNGVTVS